MKSRPKVIPCGGRSETFKRLCAAHARGEPCALLVDSEEPVASGDSVRQHLWKRDQWKMPGGVRDEQLHLFVQVMESWFLADPEGCAKHLKKGFRSQDLSGRPIESVSKKDVYQSLAKAVGEIAAKSYSKGQHSFGVIACLDPAKVEQASPSAKRLLDWLRSL